MDVRGAFAVVAASFALAIACTPKARPTTADRGVATAETWVALEAYGAKIKVPRGWEFARKDAIVAGVAKDAHGAWIVAGAKSRADAKEKLALGLQEMKIDLGEVTDPQRDVVLHGIAFARQDFHAAAVEGKPAHVVVLAADALPNGRGILVFIGYALASDEATRDELAEAIASLSPT